MIRSEVGAFQTGAATLAILLANRGGKSGTWVRVLIGGWLAARAVLVTPVMLGAQEVSVFAPGVVSGEAPSLYRGQFSADGQEYWFFRQLPSGEEEYRIYVTRRFDEAWSDAVLMQFGGAPHSDLYPALAPDGRTLVFSSYRRFPGDQKGVRTANLWVVVREGDEWGEPAPMTGASIPTYYESGPWFDLDGVLHFDRTTPDWESTERLRIPAQSDLQVAVPVSDPTIEPWLSWNSGYHVWHALPVLEKRYLLLDMSVIAEDGERLPSDLWLAACVGGRWTAPVTLPPSINDQQAFDNFPALMPGEDSLVFIRDFTVAHIVSDFSRLAHELTVGRDGTVGTC